MELCIRMCFQKRRFVHNSKTLMLDIEYIACSIPQPHTPIFLLHNSFSVALLPIIVRLANSKARIKPTAPLLAFDKENSIEFPLDSVHYLYKQSNPNPILLSHASL